MPRLVFSLTISADEMIRYYQGSAKSVITQAHNGQTVRFPAEHLRPYVTNDGVKGSFAIYFTDTGKFERLEKLA